LAGLLESLRREWAGKVDGLGYETLLAAIRNEPPFQALIDPDDLRFLNPANMVDAVSGYLRETNQPEVAAPAGLARVVLESLALRYASVVDRLGQITGEAARGVHIVGGGSRNEFLNQATASATGLPVRAGPVEATALGNLAVQAIAGGRFKDLEEARAYIRDHQPVREYAPHDTAAWTEARARYRALENPA
jgi:rhamnulokinase